jgi:hypothetical protein
MGKQSARRAGLDAQAGHRRERQERDRRIDAVAVEVLVAIGYAGPRNDERGNCCRRWSTANSVRCGRWSPGLGDTISVRGASRLLELARPEWMWLV